MLAAGRLFVLTLGIMSAGPTWAAGADAPHAGPTPAQKTTAVTAAQQGQLDATSHSRAPVGAATTQQGVAGSSVDATDGEPATSKAAPTGAGGRATGSPANPSAPIR